MRVLSTGFTVAEYEGKPTVSYGIVFENYSNLTVDTSGVVIRIFDEQGDPLEFGSGPRRLRSKLERTLYSLRPGERYGFGMTAYLDRFGKVPASIDVKIDWTEWSKDSDEFTPPPNLKAGGLVVTRASAETRVQFKVESPYADYRAGSHCVELVYRDKDGKIIGGMNPQYVEPGGFAPNRVTAASAEVPYVPDGTSNSRSEVYAAPGCDRAYLDNFADLRPMGP